MRFDLSSQNTKILQEQKKHRQWLIVFLGLSVTVVLGTAAALKLYGQALTHKVKVLDCRAEVHEHTEECYVYDEEKGEDVPVCGYADYLVHIHNDDCRDENGRLVCPLEEIKPHTHEDACYEERQVLICGLEGTGPVQGSQTDAAGSQPVKTPGEGNQPEQDSGAENQTTQEPATEAPADAESELVCTNKEHTHTDACYKAELSCTQEEHQHEDSCYEEALVCEAEEHQHDDSCKDEEGNLICDLEEHEHGDGCYERTLTCETEEHSHEDACYASRVLTCEIEEHQHGDACYTQAAGGTTAAPETKAPETKAVETTAAATTAGETTAAAGTTGTGTHVHTAACYETKLVPVCGKLEKHIHDEDCYDKDGKLICELPQLEEHVHNKDCFKTVELTDEEIAALNAGAKLHIHHEECYDENGEVICGHNETHIHGPKCYNRDGELICGHDEAHVHDSDCYDRDGELICGLEVVVHEHDEDCYDENGKLICDHAHIHEESCFDEDGNMTCDFEDVGDYLWTCEEEDYIVTVKFNHEAKIPGNAKLIAEQITADGENQEYFAQREEEYKEAMKDETAEMRALLRVGFYVEDKEAKKDEDKLIEIEPETPVTVTVQFLDEDGLKEGDPITVVHFAKEGTELLDGGQAEDNSTTFEMNGFSDIAIGYGNEGAKATVSGNGIDESVSGNSVSGNGIEGETIRLDDSFEYDAAPFHIVFHVEGEAKAADGQTLVLEQPAAEAPEEDASMSQENSDKGEDTELTDGEDTLRPEEDAASETGEDEAGGENADDEEPGEAEETPGNKNSTDTEEKIDKEKLELNVESLEEDPVLNEAVIDYLGESTETIQRDVLHMFSYGLTYDDVELDLSDCKVTAEITLNVEVEEYLASFAETGDEGIATAADVDNETSKEATADDSKAEETSVDATFMVLGVSEDKQQVNGLAKMELTTEDVSYEPMVAELNSGVLALAAEATSNPTFTVQYYAYAQIMEDKDPGDAEAIKIIDTCQEEGVKGRAELPQNGRNLKTRNMYVKDTGEKNDYGSQTGNGKQYWEIFEPVYKKRDLDSDPNCTDSLTKLYTSDRYEFREAASGLDHINKFAKAGLNFDLYEVWILEDLTKADSLTKEGWKVYRGEDVIKQLKFFNSSTTDGSDGAIVITNDTVIRLVGKSNTKDHNYPARFFDYDITDGTKNVNLQGINNPLNYAKGSDGKVEEPRFGFGNGGSCGSTGLEKDELNGYWINQAVKDAKSILQKCSYGLVQTSLSADGYPQIKANAPDLFGPQSPDNIVNGKTEIAGYSLDFKRDGDTYTLMSVAGSGTSAQNLNQFQKGVSAWYPSSLNVKNPDQIWTNQFWPMDNASTFGDTENNHDPKFGTKSQNNTTGLATADDGKEHNSFFGMTFEVEFELTDDYVGPLNYYFFGDDDMWVFLEYPEGETGINGQKTQLICDIGGVHQAAGEYVDLWNYIQKPQDGDEITNSGANSEGEPEERPTKKYKLKFFYTERGASGSTCWMQFTLPSVNAVPVIDYTGNVKSTLTLNKKVDGVETTERFDFTIRFEGEAANIAFNDYPYIITRANGDKEPGDIRSGGKFKLGDGDSIEIFNLPDNTKYIIEESVPGYEPDLGKNSSGTITKDETVEGNIDWKKDDIVDYINKEISYNLPETGGPGTNVYTMAGALCIMLSAGLMYRKKFRGRRV